MLSPEDFDRLTTQARFVAAVRDGLGDLDAGRVVSDEDRVGSEWHPRALGPVSGATVSRCRPRRNRMHRADSGHGVALSELEVASDAAAVGLRLPVEERDNDGHVPA